ncbi:MAG: hypothetical protein J0J01_18120 [Reyranella sp.]|uniref:molecular chaperone DnaJ n=1 Tax=Reyranella sp. TaxID=1929291 RepID=UPI001AC25554|nr:molecular chaperone DnaJ [Reyranella sp.]MBN9088826.1 hypothetical protein [Reyranella sp.]
MPAVLLALAVLAVLGIGLFWFMRANPSSVARTLRPLLVGLAVIGVGGLLIFGMRLLPELLPVLLPIAGFAAIALLRRWLNRQPSGDFNQPGGQRTHVNTAFIYAWLEHGTGDIGGRVLQGRFAGRSLETMTEGELRDLYGDCASDSDSLKVLESYLDRRLGADWRQASPPPRGPHTDMTRQEALATLGLQEGATDEEIRAAHRRLIVRMHPDAGGTAELAALINRAKDVLLGL